MSPRNGEFHRVKTIDGQEIEVLDEGHLREMLITMFKWLITGGLVSLIGAGIFFARMYDATSDAARDISALRTMREEERALASIRQQQSYALEKQVDSLRFTLQFVQPQIADLSEDIAALRRAMRQPR